MLSSALGGSYVNDFLNNERVKRVYIKATRRTGCCRKTSANGRCAATRGKWCRSARSLAPVGRMARRNCSATTAARVMSLLATPHPASARARQWTRSKPSCAKCPCGIGYGWIGASLQERTSRARKAPLLYAISILFVFLCLAALYESWTVPLAVILAVPLGVIGALAFTGLRGLSNDVYFQVGLLTTVGLASKNAILIVNLPPNCKSKGAI